MRKMNNNAENIFMSFIILIIVIFIVTAIFAAVWGFLAFIGVLALGIGFITLWKSGWNIDHPLVLGFIILGILLMIFSHVGLEIFTFEHPLSGLLGSL